MLTVRRKKCHAHDAGLKIHILGNTMERLYFSLIYMEMTQFESLLSSLVVFNLLYLRATEKLRGREIQLANFLTITI